MLIFATLFSNVAIVDKEISTRGSHRFHHVNLSMNAEGRSEVTKEKAARQNTKVGRSIFPACDWLGDPSAHVTPSVIARHGVVHPDEIGITICGPAADAVCVHSEI